MSGAIIFNADMITRNTGEYIVLNDNSVLLIIGIYVIYECITY